MLDEARRVIGGLLWWLDDLLLVRNDEGLLCVFEGLLRHDSLLQVVASTDDTAKPSGRLGAGAHNRRPDRAWSPGTRNSCFGQMPRWSFRWVWTEWGTSVGT